MVTFAWPGEPRAHLGEIDVDADHLVVVQQTAVTDIPSDDPGHGFAEMSLRGEPTAE